MFSGIVSDLGQVISIEKKEGKTFCISFAKSNLMEVGHSLCVNGVCTTATEIKEDCLYFFASKQTLAITNLDDLKVGHPVNLELSLTLNQALNGHLVYGHIDKTLPITAITKGMQSHIFRLAAEREDLAYVIEKGSICLEGISLTVYSIGEKNTKPYLEVMIIPHTYQNTTLKTKKVGDALNVEFDPLAKYVKRQLSLSQK